MKFYENKIIVEMKSWQKRMLARPSFINGLAKKMQTKINTWIPEKIYKAVTATIKQMVRAVLFGAKYTTARPL